MKKDQTHLETDDRIFMNRLQECVLKVTPILREQGMNQLADDLLITTGYAEGALQRVKRDFQKYQDQIAGALV